MAHRISLATLGRHIAEDLARIYRNPRHREVGYPPSHHNCRTAVQQSHGLRLSILRV